jgi:hypothetical protein
MIEAEKSSVNKLYELLCFNDNILRVIKDNAENKAFLSAYRNLIV